MTSRGVSRPALALLLGTVLAAGPAADAWAEPRAVGLRPHLSSDEGGLWDEFDRAESAAKASADINNDVTLNQYVKHVACNVASEYCGDIRVYVMDRPVFNATMAPNGYTEVWSGLLLRAGNEAELSFVIGHEAGHFIENHSIEAWRAQKTRTNVVMAVSVAIAVAGAAASTQASTADAVRAIRDATDTLVDAVYLAYVAAYFAFSRKNEEEADRLGFQYAVRAGYAPTAGAAIWQSLMDETASSDFPTIRAKTTRPSIYDSHPIDADRVAALSALAKQEPASGDFGRERYRVAIRPHLANWLKDDLRRRDYGRTIHLIDRLAADGEDLGVLQFYKGEAYRRRRNDGDPALALKAYLSASAQPDAPVAVWRELGDLQLKAGQTGPARASYETYLAKAPSAQDRWLIEVNLKKLVGTSGS